MIYLPFAVSILVWVAATLLQPSPRPQLRDSRLRVAALAAVVLAAIAANASGSPAGVALATGFAVAAAIGWMLAETNASPGASMSGAAVGAFIANMSPTFGSVSARDSSYSLLIGAGAIALIAGPILRTYVISVIIGVSANLLGSSALNRGIEVMPGVAILVLGALGAIAFQVGTKRNELTAMVGTSILLVAGSALFGAKYVDLQDALVLCSGAAALAILLAFSQGEEAEQGTVLLQSVIWLAAATVAFSMRKGFGMSLVLAAGAITFLSLNRPKALLTMGPLLGLVLYRIFRDANLEATRSLDIGQHYALIGLLLGGMLPLIPGTLIAKYRAESGALAFGAFLTAIPVVTLALLDSKGVIGVVAGLGVAGVLAALAREDAEPFPAIALIAGGAFLTFPLSEKILELTREDKVQWLWAAIVAGALLAAIVRFAPKTLRQEEPVDAF
jgi:hypothetical protein